MIQDLIARFGILRVAGAALILAAVLWLGAKYAIAGIKTWMAEKRAERAERALVVEQANNKVLQGDLKQTDRAGDIAAETTTKQDQTAIGQRQNTAKAVEVIHERIVQVPVAVLPTDDLIVRAAVGQARDRAAAAQGRVRGAQAD